MVKKDFDTPLTDVEIKSAAPIIHDAEKHGVSTIINVGTSLIESENCVTLAREYSSLYATVGIHPNDCTPTWRNDFAHIKNLVAQKEENKIVGIGECGIDRHYPGYDLQRQNDAFRAHIDLALEHNLGLVVHSRDAYDETLRTLEEYKGDIKKGTMHCFSYDQDFADEAIAMGFFIGIDAPITYPKNELLRNIVKSLDLRHIVLETDAPFLPPQEFRGKQNHPQYLAIVAECIAQLKNETVESVAQQTTKNAKQLFGLE
jgi:TatD DNase family protein